MKQILVTIYALCIFTVAQAQHPYVQNLDSVAQITFPDRPKLTIKNNIKVYTLNNGIIYMAQITDYEKSVVDYLSGGFADSLYKGFAEGISKGGTVIYKKKINTRGIDGCAVIARVTVNGQVNYRYHELYYFSHKLIAVGLWSTDSASLDHPVIKELFSSFKPTISTEKIKRNDAEDIAHITGSAIGTLLAIGLFFGIIAIVIISIIFTVKRFRRKQDE